MIVYNTGHKPVIIVYQWHPDPLGGMGVVDTHAMILPGDGIDLSICGLGPKKKKGRKKKRKKK